VAPDPGQHRRVEPRGLGHQTLFHGGTVFGLQRRWELFDDPGDDPGMLGGHNTVGLGGSHPRKQRRQCIAGDPAPRTQVDGGRISSFGLGRGQPQHIAQQGLGVTRGQFTGDPALIQFGDQRVIHDRQPPPLGFQPAQQLE
jgi:hypothetical protein